VTQDTSRAETAPRIPAQPGTPPGTGDGDLSVAHAAKETLEDYTLRFAPRSYRRWSTGVVAVSALGGIAYLADFAIGANIGISYGTTNALWGIGVFAVVVLATGFPLAYYAARYNLDLDLITRGSGFGYYGSVVTNVIFATFTFIFFALEGSIMAQGLQLGLGVPLWLGYAVSTVVIFPLVVYGMKVLSTLQLWTTPLWLVLMVAPFAYLLISHPDSVGEFFAYQGEGGNGTPSFGAVMLAAGVCLSLIAQIAEQIDYLRFMPPKTAANRRRWWAAVLLAGPGWVLFGAAKQVVGLFLAVYILASAAGQGDGGAAIANQPVHQFLEIYRDWMPAWAAVALAVVLVVISQVKINVTNAYSGSLAWTNSFTRLTRRYPGRLVFVGVNLAIALALMELNMFDFLNTILGFYANCGIAWIVVVAVDIAVNKYVLGLSPKQPEFRRGMLYDVNPVGFVSMLAAAGVSIVCFFGGLGAGLAPFSPLVAVVLAAVLPPVLAVATKGRYYLRRADDGIDAPVLDDDGNPSGEVMTCHVCHQAFERPDVAACAAHSAVVCSLCLSTDRTGEHVLPADPPLARA
jgi:purine-cytosine permease-like protein